MTWELDSSRPIYAQIIERVEMDIIGGKYGPGDRLPSVRELAAEAGVNPNTMQKALSELERAGMLHSARTSGRYITEDREMIESVKENLAIQYMKEFLEKMERMGYDTPKAMALMERLLRGEQP